MSFNQIFPRVIRHFSSFCMGKWIYQIASTTHKNSCFAANPNLFFRNHHNCRNTCLKSFTAPAPKKLTFHCMACLEAIPQKVSRRISEKSRVDNQSIDLSLQNIPNITKYHRWQLKTWIEFSHLKKFSKHRCSGHKTWNSICFFSALPFAVCWEILVWLQRIE